MDLKGKTSTGFEFQVEEETLNDYELLELVAKVDDGYVLGTPKLVEMILGEEQTKALKNHCRADNGRVPVEVITAEITEIFQSGQAKN